ncbi:hypothetical protein SCP_1702530 [Sparassis crispa]|uniref:Uncharacterized protein n=1 Tax=Sparassis crispa TaxID=139825 RepID=A0A401H655_9APHY|nr:hypothetical protein SCP_1702530 [Sparassis crispa]GBE89927.1 hypothetical protein SCP_1702530 [Sparassis crispa]
MTEVCIALYKSGQKGRYHWALVLPSGNATTIGNNADVFQIRLNESWVPSHQRVTLTSSISFLCCIRLPPAVGTNDELKGIIASFDASQGDTKLLFTHTSWTCAQWVIRSLGALVEGRRMDGAVTASGKEMFYARINAIGSKVEEGSIAGQVVYGVRVVSWDVNM